MSYTGFNAFVYEVFTMLSFWRLRDVSGGLENIGNPVSVIIGLQMVKNAKKFGQKNWEFLEKFWSFGEFLEWFGGCFGEAW